MLFVLLAWFHTASAAEPAPPPHEIVVMTVDGRPITQAAVDTARRRVPPEQMELIESRGAYGEWLQRLAVMDALHHQAVESNLASDPEVAQALEHARREVLATIQLDRLADAAVTDEAVAAAYAARSREFHRPRVHARHILVRDRQLADELHQKLTAKKARDRADFAELAAEHSQDPGTKGKGGDLGWFHQGRMVKVFSEAAFSAEPGTVVGPIESRFGFHLIEVLERADKTPLEAVRAELEREVREDAVQSAVKRIIQEMDCEVIDSDGQAEPCERSPGSGR